MLNEFLYLMFSLLTFSLIHTSIIIAAILTQEVSCHTIYSAQQSIAIFKSPKVFLMTFRYYHIILQALVMEARKKKTNKQTIVYFSMSTNSERFVYFN